MKKQVFTIEAIGTIWNISIWGNIDFGKIFKESEQIINKFEKKYSRFDKESLVSSLKYKTGDFDVTREFVDILKLYQKIYVITDKKVTPIGGDIISGLGYDSEYSFESTKEKTNVYDFIETVEIIDDEKIRINNPISFDIGALGKGYLIDIVFAKIKSVKEVDRVLINAGGDLRHWSRSNEFAKIALENPFNTQEAIGVYELGNNSLASSSTSKRRWKDKHHIYNAVSGKNIDNICATWVLHEKAVISDMLATSLFMTDVEKLLEKFDFEYIILFADGKIEFSKTFKNCLFIKK